MSNVFGSNATSPARRLPSLVVGLASRACALPLAYARETMRPLPVETMAGAPDFVLGLAIIRGHPIPVVHLARLLGARDAAQPVSRFVTLHIGDRTLALAVDSVLGVRELDPEELEPLPALLGAEAKVAVDSIGELDGELLVVLQAMGVLPEALWRRILAGDAPSR